MRELLLLVLYLTSTTQAEPQCNINAETLNCKAIEWTELSTVDTASNLSSIGRLTLSQASGVESWNTSLFSAVNFVGIDSSILMQEPFQDLVKLPHLSILHVTNTPTECWTENSTDFLIGSTLERLMMVASLNCDDALKFSLAESMHELDLSDNWLKTFPKINGRMLTYLRLTGNNLHSVDNLLGIPNLFELDISRNPIGEIPVEAFLHNPELVRLNLSSTSLEAVKFQAPYLETLTLSSNYLINLERTFFAVMPYLTILDLSGNEITELSDQFQDLTKLRQLHLSHNYIREIRPETLKNLEALEILKLDSNRLTSLPEIIDDLPCLHLLDISNNSISILDSKFFSHIPFLATLYASFNGLRNMDDAGVAMHNLKKLIVEGNNLQVDSKTFAAMEQLNTLDISNNGLTISLDVLANNMALKDVNLVRNNISDICGEQHLPLQLGSVNIAFNQISNLDCLEGLYSLNITGNPVVCGDNLKLSLKQALYTDYDSEENNKDTERIVQESDEEEWIVVYKSVCSDDPLLMSDPTPNNIINPDEDTDEDDGDETDDDDSEEYDDIEDEMEIHQTLALDDLDLGDDDDAIITKMKGDITAKSVILWAALGFAAFGFMLLSLLATVYMVIWIQNRKKRALHSQHPSAYEQLRSPVYSETTSRVPGNNFSANLGRVLKDNPVTGVFKSENMVGMLSKLGISNAAPQDELKAKMIPGDSTNSLA